MEEIAEDGEKHSRIRQRIDACRIGMQQLDALRSKHHRLMKGMRVQLGIPNDDSISNEKRVPQVEPLNMALRSCSPAPSFADMSSVVSHRSSISMDSGCVSIVSDRSQTSASSWIDGSRKLSREEFRPPTESGLSDDEGIFESKQLLETAIESTTSVRLLSKHRYQKKSSEKSMQRAKSMGLCNYPEENTVVVEPLPVVLPRRPIHWSPPRIARSESVHLPSVQCAQPFPSVITDPVYRASRVFIDPEKRSPRLIRPKSVAFYPSPGQTTWEDVKRMLDPLFDERKPSQISRQMSSASSTLTLTPTENRKFKLIKASPTVTGSNIFIASTQHDTLSRSISSQSSDSAKSAKSNTHRRKEKDWHESEEL